MGKQVRKCYIYNFLSTLSTHTRTHLAGKTYQKPDSMKTKPLYPNNTLKDIQWRWIFGATFAVNGLLQIIMFFIISIYVARSSAAGNTLNQAEILQLSDTLGRTVGPFIFLGLTFLAAIWIAIKVRVAPRLHGLVLGLVLATLSLIAEYALSPSLESFEIYNTIFVIPMAWFASYRGEKILKNREALYRTSQAISGRDRAGMLEAVGEQLASPSVVWIALADKDGDLDTASGWVSTSRQNIPSSIPSLRSQPKLASLIKADALAQPISGTRTRSILVLPLSKMDETLLIASRNKTGFSRTGTQNYQTIAEQVSLSLENFQLLEQAREAGIMQERQRLAAEIHDGLTQGFISIVTLLEVAEAKMESHTAEVRDNLHPLLNQVRQTARDNLTASREMTWALRPDLLEGEPLPDALDNLAKRWSAKNHIPINFSFSGNMHQLHPDIETVLLRTLREALNNIQKHAQAEQVTATLTYLDTLVALDVQDDGVGFDAERNGSDSEGGFGLKSLREQAEHLGGELSVESESGKGCTIAISVPDNGK